MGVHDYGSVLYNQEGEQCLITLPDTEDKFEDDQLLTFEELLNTLDYEEDDDIETELDVYLEELGVGESTAFLLFKEGKRECFIKVKYEWDAFDFSLDMFEFGYHESCEDMLPKWKMSKPKFKEFVGLRPELKKMKNPTVYNFTPREHQIYTSDKLDNISNEDFVHMSKIAGIDFKTNTRKEIFHLLKEYLKNNL